MRPEIRITWQAILAFAVLLGLVIVIGNALHGNVAALMVLAVLGTLILIAAGGSLVLATLNLQARQEDRRFQANMRENMQIMQQAQRVQSLQNQALLRQLAMPQLPAAAGGLMFDDITFSTLDDEPIDGEWETR